MARGIAASTEQLEGPDNRKPGFSFENLQEGEIEVQDLTPGLVMNLPRDKIPAGSFSELVNGRLRRSHILRRGGFERYIADADSNSVMKLAAARITGNVDYIVRVAVGSIYATASESGWTAMTTAGSQYTQFLRMTAAQFLDDLYIANFEKKIVRLQFSGMTFDEIDEAPVCRFITTFADRILAAYVSSPGGLETTQIKWSGNANPLVWDPLEDISAGEENLISSPSDTGDEITGIFAFGQNLAVLLRERSIWHITRQPYASAPFRFVPVVTDLGCDMPYTAVRTPNGVVFCDFRTNGVWLYAPGSPPQRISEVIELDGDGEDFLFKDINIKEQSEGIYAPRTKEYIFGYNTDVSNTSRLDNIRIFNFAVPGWATDTGWQASTIAVLPKVGTPSMIDDLVGMIDGLTGTIDELSTQGNKPSLIVKGDENGRVMDQDGAHATDRSLADTLTKYELELASQNIVGVDKRRKLKRFLAIISSDLDEDAVISLSKNGGSFTDVKSYDDLTGRTKIGIKRTHRVGDKLKWKIKSTATNFRLFEWSMKILEKGPKGLEEE